MEAGVRAGAGVSTVEGTGEGIGTGVEGDAWPIVEGSKGVFAEKGKTDVISI